MIYWLTGQPGAGKTTLATWIQSSFPNKSMIVDGDDLREIFINKDYSEEGRQVEMGDDLVEVYVHTKNIRGRENFHVNYEEPLTFFIDCDTTDSSEYNTFLELRRKLKI